MSAHTLSEEAGEIAKFVAENATLGLVMMDARHHCTYLNAAAERIFGWTLDEILAQDKPLHDIIHYLRPDGTPYAMSDCPIDRALPKRAREVGEDVFVHRDGHFYPVAFTASPILRGGVAVGTIIEVRDLTLERERSRALHESEERFRFLTESLPVQVWTATPAGYLDYVSSHVTAYFGMSAEALLEDNWRSVVCPEDLPGALERWTHCLATGEPYEVEFRLRAVDGSYRWHLVRALAQRDAEGGVVRWFGTNTDIHDRRTAEAIAQRERGRLREVFTQAPAVIALYEGAELRVSLANELYKKFTGRHEPVGKTFAELFPELQGTETARILERSFASGQPFATEEMYVPFDRNGDGIIEDMWWNFVLQPILDVDGRSESLLVHAVEVTGQVQNRREIEHTAAELRRLAAALERSNEDLNQFAYVASHDLKAPLRGIANLAQWIEEDLGEALTGTSREHLNLLRGRVERMSALIDGILAYSRAGRTTGSTESIDVRALVQDVIELLAPPAGAELTIATPMPVVDAERVPLQQVFMNLIGNALKYNPTPAPKVEVGCDDAGATWEFWVRDNGPGIDPAYHEQIWGVFSRLEARDRVEGTGIGLSVVRKIVDAFGGRAWVESELGAGATFRFTWPKSGTGNE